MVEDSTHNELRVIIVGGSIAGLTLAHALSALNATLSDGQRAKAAIKYTVLEKRPSLTPQEGASIGILPHGGRILDQLGLFGPVESEIQPFHTAHIRFPGGPNGYVGTNESPRVMEEKFGLPLAFLERRSLLRILAEGLGIGGQGPNSGVVARVGGEGSRVLCDKEVVRIEIINKKRAWQETVLVRTKDGAIYEGDLVVGCDGVHSMVRREMWRNSARDGKDLDPGKRRGLTAEYACIFGISSGVPGLKASEHVASLNDKRSFLTFPGNQGRTFWFLIWKLDRKYIYADGDMPRFTESDARSTAARYADDIVWDEVTFGDLWDRRIRHNTTILEENVFDTWHYRRMICIGDSIHKMAPNTGHGANCAIEDAASIANLLHEIVVSRSTQTLSTEQLEERLSRCTAERRQRVQKIYNITRMVVRFDARDTFFFRFLGRFVLPYAGNIPARAGIKAIEAAPRLNFLPVSSRVASRWSERSTQNGSSIVRLVLSFMLIASGAWIWRTATKPTLPAAVG
ncbi:FAD/NAD(P)-binding domain-containing protein [Aspergillus heterothallicus]